MFQRKVLWTLAGLFLFTVVAVYSAHGASEQFKGQTRDLEDYLKPVDSATTLKVGDKAPDFTLTTITGEKVSLSQYLGEKNIVLSFVPAAFTPVCSEQWPGYNIMKEFFAKKNATLIGITTDNLPTLHAWTAQMGGVWFPVASDFWPHGEVAAKYGILRSSGVAERAIFVLDKQGIIQYIDIHDINDRPDLEVLFTEMQKLKP